MIIRKDAATDTGTGLEDSYFVARFAELIAQA
jgi:hypothetical protein